MMVTSNVVGRGKSARPSATEVRSEGIFRSTRNRSRAHQEEEFSDVHSAMAESETNNSASELEVSVNMPEGSGHGNINIAELLQRQDEQQKTLDELKAMIQMLAENASKQRED